MSESGGDIFADVSGDILGGVRDNVNLSEDSVGSGIDGDISSSVSGSIGAGVSDGVGRDVAVGTGGGDGRWLVNDQVLEAAEVVLIQYGQPLPNDEQSGTETG